MAQIGDLVPKHGIYTEPGVVVAKKEEEGSVVIDTEPLAIHEFHRYSNTTGLTLEEKRRFNAILDEIYAHPSNVDRLADIQAQIDELKIDPSNKNVVQYLRNQQASLIRESRQLPRYYNADEAVLKT